MVVKIRSAEGPKLLIPIPTGLFCNRLTAGFTAKMMAQNGWTATPGQMVKLFRTIRMCKRRHPGWIAVEVHSADGDEVIVKL